MAYDKQKRMMSEKKVFCADCKHNDDPWCKYGSEPIYYEPGRVYAHKLIQKNKTGGCKDYKRKWWKLWK